MNDKREFICKRVAQELHEGDVINLGIGLPTFVANYIPKGMNVILQSENGMLGLDGKVGADETPDLDVTDAGGSYVKVATGGCFFDSATSFSIIRGGHVSVTVLGALEVDELGNLASWMIPGKRATGMGGAMDLVVGAKKVIIAMEHVSKNGGHRIVERCSMPLTAVSVVDRIITDLGVFDVTKEGLYMVEIAPDATREMVTSMTGCAVRFAPDLKTVSV